MSKIDSLLIHGSVLKFHPDAGWSWKGWNGKLSLKASMHGVRIEKKPVALAGDIELMASHLIGKRYVSKIHKDIPGVVVSATITVKTKSLSRGAPIGGSRMPTTRTTGKFTISCTPAIKAGSPPIPDPVVVKTGKFTVLEPAQNIAQAY